MGIADTWAEPWRLAGEVTAAETWRQQLADALLTAGEVRLVTVWTCPPAQPLEARGATSPKVMHPSVDAMQTQVLPQVERTAEGAAQQRGRLTSEPYLPFEQTRQTRLVRKAVAGYAPAGVEALVMSWMLDGEGLPLGFVGMGDGGSGPQLLERIGPPLQAITDRAAKTLERALALARGLGALPPPPPSPGAEPSLLTARERQVAKLVAEGFTDEGVGLRLGLSEHTVGVHLRRIFRKLAIHTRSELSTRGILAMPEPPPKTRRGPPPKSRPR